MRIYVEKEFMNHFISLQNQRSKGIDILWSIIKDYAEVIWVFNEEVKKEDFDQWEISNVFYATISSKASNGVVSVSNFVTDIRANSNEIQILLTTKSEQWHQQFGDSLLVFLPEDFETQIENIAYKFSFRFIADQNHTWKEFEKLKSPMIKRVTITDKYIIDKFIKNKNTKVLDSYSNVLHKFLNNCNVKLDLLVKSIDVRPNQIDELNEKFNFLSQYCKQNISSNLSLTVINAELKGDFDFHDRNIITNFYIIKAGKGFEKERNKNSNTEIECYSFLDKWGYDLIRHRKKMIQTYLTKIETVQSTFKIYQS